MFCPLDWWCNPNGSSGYTLVVTTVILAAIFAWIANFPTMRVKCSCRKNIGVNVQRYLWLSTEWSEVLRSTRNWQCRDWIMSKQLSRFQCDFPQLIQLKTIHGGKLFFPEKFHSAENCRSRSQWEIPYPIRYVYVISLLLRAACNSAVTKRTTTSWIFSWRDRLLFMSNCSRKAINLYLSVCTVYLLCQCQESW